MRRYLPTFASFLLLTGCAGETVSELVPQTGHVHGIDISKYQGEIDWGEVRRSGVKFAFIKATEGGDRIDDRFAANWRGAKAAGVARGAYHFYYFCRTAADQIAWFKTHVPNDPDALPPVLDMEWNGHSPTCTKKPPRETVIAEMRVFLAAAERHYGKRPIIYAPIDFHREILVGEFKNHPFWLRSVKGHPDTKYEDRDWVFWQYTATGTVAGIKGDVDRNIFNGSPSAWKKWLESVTRKPAPVRAARDR